MRQTTKNIAAAILQWHIDTAAAEDTAALIRAATGYMYEDDPNEMYEAWHQACAEIQRGAKDPAPWIAVTLDDARRTKHRTKRDAMKAATQRTKGDGNRWDRKPTTADARDGRTALVHEKGERDGRDLSALIYLAKDEPTAIDMYGIGWLIEIELELEKPWEPEA